MTARILHGDCLDVMPTLDAASVDAIVTDPPYGLGFMGVKWDTYGAGKGRRPSRKHTFDQVGGNSHARKPGGVELIRAKENRRFQAKATEWATAMLRVAKPGAHLVAFGGTRTYHRLTCAIEDAGWEIRDCLSWLYGSGFPKSLDVSKALDKAAGVERVVTRAGAIKQGLSGIMDTKDSSLRERRDEPATTEAYAWDGWGTALKPGWEPIILARKPLAGTVAANVAAHGTGALNIDGCRIAGTKPAMERTTTVVAARAMAGESTGARSIGLTSEGRWPANVVLDEDAAALLDQQSGELTSGDKKPGGIRPVVATHIGIRFGERTGTFSGDSGGASRFFYTAKASRSEREAMETGNGSPLPISNHPTVKPLDLMRWLVRLVTPPNGLVLDPFCGSGTTGCAAMAEGFRFIGMEREAEYLAIANARLNATQPALGLGA